MHNLPNLKRKIQIIKTREDWIVNTKSPTIVFFFGFNETSSTIWLGKAAAAIVLVKSNGGHKIVNSLTVTFNS